MFECWEVCERGEGGPDWWVPITPDCVAVGPGPLEGIQMVGEPGSRCEEALGCPAPVHGAKVAGVLSTLDLRIFDAICSADPSMVVPFKPPAGFALDRGTCCGYTFQLFAQDKTWSDSVGPSPLTPCSTGVGLHWATSLPWPVTFLNDFDPNKRVAQCL